MLLQIFKILKQKAEHSTKADTPLKFCLNLSETGAHATKFMIGKSHQIRMPVYYAVTLRDNQQRNNQSRDNLLGKHA